MLRILSGNRQSGKTTAAIWEIVKLVINPDNEKTVIVIGPWSLVFTIKSRIRSWLRENGSHDLPVREIPNRISLYNSHIFFGCSNVNSLEASFCGIRPDLVYVLGNPDLAIACYGLAVEGNPEAKVVFEMLGRLPKDVSLHVFRRLPDECSG